MAGNVSQSTYVPGATDNFGYSLRRASRFRSPTPARTTIRLELYRGGRNSDNEVVGHPRIGTLQGRHIATRDTLVSGRGKPGTLSFVSD